MDKNRDQKPDILTVPESADFLRIGRTQMYKLIREGSIKHIKIGRKILIPRKYLIDFVENMTILCYNKKQVDSQPCYKEGEFYDESNRELTA